MNEEIKTKIGENIKKLREARNLTQEDLADKSELHPTYISLLERGKKACSIKTLSKIASALNVSTGKMLDSIDKVRKIKQKKENPVLRKIQSLLSKRTDNDKKAVLKIIKNFLNTLDEAKKK